MGTKNYLTRDELESPCDKTQNKEIILISNRFLGNFQNFPFSVKIKIKLSFRVYFCSCGKFYINIKTHQTRQKATFYVCWMCCIYEL